MATSSPKIWKAILIGAIVVIALLFIVWFYNKFMAQWCWKNSLTEEGIYGGKVPKHLDESLYRGCLKVHQIR